MQQASASAPGKLMLLGEHAVIYNRSCLVTAVDLRVHVRMEKTERYITINSSTTEQEYCFTRSELLSFNQAIPEEISFVLAAIVLILEKYNMYHGIHVITKGPKNSFGLGSSSAVTVATVRAMSEILELSLSQREIFDLSYQAVLNVQGKASGFDLAAAVYGGTLYFCNARKEIIPLGVKKVPIVIGFSGSKANTVDLVNAVSRLYNKYPWAIESIFDLIQWIVDEAKGKIISNEWEDIGKLMNLNQGLLDSLGVNTLSLSRIIFSAREAGALGAKLSGAGGGDCMFALVKEETRALVRKAMEEAGAQIVDLDSNVAGVRIEEITSER